MEIELKLLMEPSDLERVSRSTVVSKARRGRTRTVVLHTIYYDTPDGLLWREGVALRLRRAGTRWIQSLKGGGEEYGGLHRREEIEWPVAAGAPDVGLLLTTPHAKLISRSRVIRNLVPVFETEFRRRRIDLELSDGSTAQLCLDSGEVRAGKLSEPICEAEVELVRGESGALLGFARDLLLERNFRIGTLSKAERGHAIAASAGPQGPVRAVHIPMDGSAGAAEAFGRIVQSAARQVHGNERGFLELADPEYLHQLRVGLRRLRVALALPRGEAWEASSRPVRERLAALSRLLGEARNWDVFAGEVLRPRAAHCDAKLLSGLKSRAGLRRASALSAARDGLRSRDTTRIWLDLAGLMTAPHAVDGANARAFASASLDLRHRRLQKAAETLDSPENMHRLRIAAKKLRYVSEFFADLYPHKKVKRYLAALAGLQDDLGAVNDATICRQLVTRADAGVRPLPAEARGIALGWIAAGGATAESRVKHTLKGPLGAAAFWR